MTTESGSQRASGNPKTSGAWRRNTAVWTRWLHTYLSMFSFGLILFFAVTGLTLNHPGWFLNQAKTVQRHGVAAQGQVRMAGPEGADRLGLVEMLRAREHLHGAVTDFRVDDGQIAISFRAPGYTADAFIDRDSGKYDLTEVRSGAMAVINDLHKGQDAGKVWSALIDGSAVFLVVVSVTGLVLILFMTRKRTTGLLLAGFAVAAVVLVWRLAVP